jgi:hypothetical protein
MNTGGPIQNQINRRASALSCFYRLLPKALFEGTAQRGPPMTGNSTLSWQTAGELTDGLFLPLTAENTKAPETRNNREKERVMSAMKSSRSTRLLRDSEKTGARWASFAGCGHAGRFLEKGGLNCVASPRRRCVLHPGPALGFP